MEFISGNIYIRKNACDSGRVVEGHHHNFAHTTLLLSGRWHVKREWPNGEVRESEYSAPHHLLIEADVKHTITCLEAGMYWCVYSHRNPQGDIVQEYDGWNTSYV